MWVLNFYSQMDGLLLKLYGVLLYTSYLPSLVIVPPNLLVLFICNRVTLGLEKIFECQPLSYWWACFQPKVLDVVLSPSVWIFFSIFIPKKPIFYSSHTSCTLKLTSNYYTQWFNLSVPTSPSQGFISTFASILNSWWEY